MSGFSRRSMTVAASLVVALVLGIPAIARADCADADLRPSAQNLDRVRAAVVCLHNEQRARRGLPALHQDARLRRAAERHSRDMVSDGFFAHASANGSSFVERILAARYVRRYDGYLLGENLAWGTAELSTPRGVVQAWMASPEHRANLLTRAYRDVGIGIRLGVPKDPGVGATFTVDFGVRR